MDENLKNILKVFREDAAKAACPDYMKYPAMQRVAAAREVSEMDLSVYVDMLQREMCSKNKTMVDQRTNAAHAMSETHGSWEERCYAIMAALNLNFGEFSVDVPEEGSYYHLSLRKKDEEIERLETENRNLSLQLEKADYEI